MANSIVFTRLVERTSLPEIIRQAHKMEPAKFSQQVVTFFGPAIRKRIETLHELTEAEMQLLWITTFVELGSIIKKLPSVDNDFIDSYQTILDELVPACQWKIRLALSNQKPVDIAKADTQWQTGILRWIDELITTPDSTRIKRLLAECDPADKAAIASRTLRAIVAYVAYETRARRPVFLFASHGRYLEIDRKLGKPYLLEQIDLYTFLYTDHSLAGAFIAEAMINLRFWLRKGLLKEGVRSENVEEALNEAESEVYNDLLKKRDKPDDEKSNVGADASLTTTVISFVKQSRFIYRYLKGKRTKSDTDLVERTAQEPLDEDEENSEYERAAVQAILLAGLKQLGQDCQEILQLLYLKSGPSMTKKAAADQTNEKQKAFYRHEERCRDELADYVREECKKQQLTIRLR